MKRFLSSAWFPLLMCLVLAGVTVAAYAVLKPTGADINNSQLVMALQIAGWAIGPVAGLLSFIVICILNLIRRIIRMRKVGWMHPVTILLGIGFWLVVSWVLLDEPRYTDFAAGILDFVARPLLWGSLTATLLTIILAIFVIPSSSVRSTERSEGLSSSKKKK
ncbi:MAG: hypothetical protein HOO67_02725 [Candidatus Peribacteraceae bacterium]|nr:hypothetical protein [Candidatus Peribacteraceae bacterium]